MRVPRRVTIVEVGPRDGLQNEKAPIATADKITLVDRLSEAGHAVIEVSAFVSPKWVPQWRTRSSVAPALPASRESDTPPSSLNPAGLERAMAAASGEVAIFAAPPRPSGRPQHQLDR